MSGYSKRYRENRLIVLRGNPICSYCRMRKATTVDHIIETDRGGGDELDNLTPACSTCNSRKGQRYVTMKKNAVKAAQAKREEAVELEEERRTRELELDSTTESVFGGGDLTPRAIGGSVSQGTERRQPPKTSRKVAQPVAAPSRDGRPRLESPLPQGRLSYGSEVESWALDNLGVTFMPWQRHVIDGILTRGADDEAGRLQHRLSLVTCARQQGKTTALKALIGWWLTEAHRHRGGPQVVLSTAHALDLAYQLFQELAPVLETKYGADVKWSYGRNELIIPTTGSTWLVRAATPSAGHGRSVDLVVADELFGVSEEALEQGMLPAQRARRSPLCAMWSTAGTEHSKLLQRMREQGLRTIDGKEPGPFYFAEYSPPAGADVSSPDTWLWANPAIGHTIELETLEAESRGPNRSAFLRGSLNLWVATDHSWLEPGLWEQLATPAEPPAATVIAVDSAMDESRYCGVRAGITDDGKVHLSVAFMVATEAEMWAEVRRQLEPATMLAITPTLEIHTPPEIRRRTTVGYGELLKWTQLVKAMVGEGRVVHAGDVSMADHIARAVAVKTQAGVVISSQRSPGPIELARCAVWAAALASKAKWSSKPAMGSRRR